MSSDQNEDQFEKSSEEQEDNQKDNQKINQKPRKKKRVRKRKKALKAALRGNNFSTSNFKTQRCEFFNKGHCSKGSECTYRHDFVPDTNRKICKFFLSGACSKQNCPYSHNTKIYPCLFYHIDRACQLGNNCRFSHEPIPPDFLQQYLKDHKEHILRLYKEGKLPDESMVNPFRDQLPKSQPILPPIDVSKPVVKQDPRLKIRKQLAEAADAAAALKVKKEEIKQEIILMEKVEEQDLDTKFNRCIRQLMFSYY